MFFFDQDRDQNIFDWDRHQNLLLKGPGPKFFFTGIGTGTKNDWSRSCLGALVPIEISGKEEIRISRCGHKKLFLKNITSVNKMRIRIQKMLDLTSSTQGRTVPEKN
jgi:hypothetical protein